MSNAPSRLLDVGNCNPDHYQILMMLERHFDVAVDRVMFVDDALEKMRASRYDLVLFNRLVFEDSSEGLELVRRARSAGMEPLPPMMMVSNLPEAQDAAAAEGAVRGFGKAKVHDAGTVELLGRFLKRIAATTALR